MHGGLAQGIAQALYEEARVRRGGQPGHRDARRLPAARRRPTCRPSSPTARRRPSTTNRLGIKGVGEAGTIASTPAIVNAIVDALRPLGVNDVDDALHARARLAGHRDGQRHVQGASTAQRAAQCRALTEAHGAEMPHDPRSFDYVRPGPLDEAVAALAAGGEDAKVIAGGQSLLPGAAAAAGLRPTLLVDVGAHRRAAGNQRRRRRLVIGAGTTHYRGACTTPSSPSTAACSPRPPATVADPADPAPRHARRRAGARRPGRRPAGGGRSRWTRCS